MPCGEPQRDMAFSFLQHSDEAAAAELGDVLCVLVDIPETEAAKAQAMARYAQELTQEAEAEHKRLQERLQDLRKRELDLRARLGQMAAAQEAVGDPAQD